MRLPIHPKMLNFFATSFLALLFILSIEWKALATLESIYDALFTTISGEKQDFSKYKGKVLLLVNTASKCGYTKQYDGLEKLYQKYKDKNFVIIGFPSNDFGNQEPGTNEEIANFCKLNFGVSFPMSQRVVVKGDGKVELFRYLTSKAKPSGEIGWNFEKFLIGRDGKIINRFKSAVEPMSDEIVKAVEAAL